MADARPFHWEYTPEPVAREVFRVEGGRPLAGTVAISGAKNAALKLLAAATLTAGRSLMAIDHIDALTCLGLRFLPVELIPGVWY